VIALSALQWPDGGATSLLQCGPVAQLDRASDYESEGRAFESLRVRQKIPKKNKALRIHLKCAASRSWIDCLSISRFTGFFGILERKRRDQSVPERFDRTQSGNLLA
jgi:hypothetical protein